MHGGRSIGIRLEARELVRVKRSINIVAKTFDNDEKEEGRDRISLSDAPSRIDWLRRGTIHEDGEKFFQHHCHDPFDVVFVEPKFFQNLSHILLVDFFKGIGHVQLNHHNRFF